MNFTAPYAICSSTWHICWHAATGRDFLANPTTTARIRSRLLQTHGQSGRVLFFFLLTPSEIHLLSALPEGESARDIAREVANVVARWVRRMQDARDPVFAARYLAHRVDDVETLKEEIRFLSWRPVALGLCKTATHYSHSALRAAVGMSAKNGFDVIPLWQLFGDSKQQARDAIRALLSQRPSIIEVRQWELNHSLKRAPGAAGPWASVWREVHGHAAMLVAASESKSIDGALALLERWVAARLGLDASQPLANQRTLGARGRALVASLALVCGLCSAASVARHFGRAKATLSEQMAACRARAGDRAILDTPMDRIVEEAIALADSRLTQRR